MRIRRKGGRISDKEDRAEGQTDFQQRKVKRLDWDGILQVMPYRPHLVLREEGLFVREDRLPNFRDGGLDFTRADGKEAMNGFPARNSGEEEDTDFRQKETDGSDGTIG